MKKLLIIFGLLDLIAVIKSLQLIISLIENGNITYWTNVGLMILYVSLIFSGILQIITKKAGLWIYYFQFPLRLLYTVGFSFGFMLLLTNLFPDKKQTFQIISILCMILEFARLTLTIMIHRKYFSKMNLN
jgi:hypothetical protein